MSPVALNLLFLLAAGGAWAWYHVDPPQPPVRYRFDLHRDVPGYTFQPEAIPPKAAATLATTNLFNGVYLANTSAPGNPTPTPRITAFMGEWSATHAREMSVVSHTPDVCWVGTGWLPVASEHPSQIEFDFDGHRVPFEVRTFRPPGPGPRELTVWCTLVNGQPYSEITRFANPDLDPGDSPKARSNVTARRLAASQFRTAVLSRTAGTGDKQFVRFSAPIAGTGDWRPVLTQLQDFARHWLTLSSAPYGLR